jgi:hypothetical protein
MRCLRGSGRAPAVILAIVVAGCGRSPVTLVPVPDEESRVEVETSVAGWEGRVGDLLACVLRVERAAEWAGRPIRRSAIRAPEEKRAARCSPS